MKRRQFIALMGGGIILAAGSGAAAFVSTREPGKALVPWRRAARCPSRSSRPIRTTDSLGWWTLQQKIR